jgi:hypothetical protein
MKNTLIILALGISFQASAEKKLETEGRINRKSDCSGTGLCKITPSNGSGNLVHIDWVLSSDERTLTMQINEVNLQAASEAFEQISQGRFVMEEPFTFPGFFNDHMNIGEITIPAGTYTAHQNDESVYSVQFPVELH